MPELPEVETIARQLREGTFRAYREVNSPSIREVPSLLKSSSIIGTSIEDARVLWERTLAIPSIQEFTHRIVGQTILDIGRRGKYLIFSLTDDKLLIHLRMSGDILLSQIAASLAPHDRLMLHLDNGLRLAFNDTRKFGRVWLLKDPSSILDKLGPEPLGNSFSPRSLYEGLKGFRRQLKPLLMDQSFIAGLGNIYTDEALHLAHLHPKTPSNTVSESQATGLWEAIREVLQNGIRHNGASIDWVYRGGEFQNQFRVYGRKGEPCPRCSTPIERILVGQRSTHYCPSCQPEF